MCEPTIIAGMALSAAGTMYNQNQQQKNMSRGITAKNAAAEAEMIRQEGFQDEASAAFKDSQGVHDKSKQDFELEQQKQQRGAKIEKALATPNEYAPVKGSAPSVVKGEIARKINDAFKSGKKTASALGNMGAWGDQQFNNRVALSRHGGQIGEIANNARSSASLLPLEQQAAYQNAQKAPGMFGDLLKAAGTGMSMYGMAGGDAFSGFGGGVTPNSYPGSIAGTGNIYGPAAGAPTQLGWIVG